MVNDYWSGKNIWFDENYSSNITPEFAKWWLDLYGAPELYEDKDEYFTRMGFAFMGWQARLDKCVIDKPVLPT